MVDVIHERFESFTTGLHDGGDSAAHTENELLMKAISEIVQHLIEAEKKGQNVDLNKVKMAVSRKYCTQRQPKLVDIIAAVPQQHKKSLVPKLKAKPVR